MLKRSVTLDCIKGILILLVVLGHALQYGYGKDYQLHGLFYGDFLFRAIYCFHMPLFMFISGYLFYKSNQKPFVKVVLSKLKAVGIPYISYATFIIIINCLFSQSHFYLSHYMKMIRMGIEMWFLWALIVSCLIVSLVTCFVNKNRILVALILCFICIISLFISDETIIPQHKFVFFYFILGYLYHTVDLNLSLYVKKNKIFIVITILYILCILCYDEDMMIYNGNFCIVGDSGFLADQLFKDLVRWGIGLISSCWIIGFYYLVINKIELMTPFLKTMGEQTLAIYGLQSVLYTIFYNISTLYNLHFPHLYLWSILLCFLILGVCEILIKIIKHYQLLGILFLGKK